MLWSDNLPYDIIYSRDGSLLVREKFSYGLWKWFLVAGFVIFIVVAMMVPKDINIGLFLLIEAMMLFGLSLYYQRLRKTSKHDRIIVFNKTTKTIIVNGGQEIGFESIRKLSFAELEAPFRRGDHTDYQCIIDFDHHRQIILDAHKHGLVAAVLVDEISRFTGISCGLHSCNTSRINLVEYNQFMQQKKEFDAFLEKFVQYDDDQLAKVVSQHKWNANSAHKAALTIQRRKRQLS